MKKNRFPIWTKCPQCKGQAYVGQEDGSTLLTCFQCGYKAHIKLAHLLYKKNTQRDYALSLPAPLIP